MAINELKQRAIFWEWLTSFSATPTKYRSVGRHLAFIHRASGSKGVYRANNYEVDGRFYVYKIRKTKCPFGYSLSIKRYEGSVKLDYSSTQITLNTCIHFLKPLLPSFHSSMRQTATAAPGSSTR